MSGNHLAGYGKVMLQLQNVFMLATCQNEASSGEEEAESKGQRRENWHQNEVVPREFITTKINRKGHEEERERDK